jgi:hypothetical protein
MVVVDLLTSSSFGSLLGMRHALEPDHLAAVSTLVSRERTSAKAALLGLCWGLGHTVSLIVVGALLMLFRMEMPARATNLFELAVALMLIGLGLRTCLQAARGADHDPLQMHRRGFGVHRHSGLPPHLHVGRWTFARRPLLIGMVHGLAGSGALTALVMTTLPTMSAQLTYMLLFGLGSTLGMAALSGLLGWPLARLGSHERVTRGLSLLVGAMSIALGVFWGYPLVSRLLS